MTASAREMASGLRDVAKWIQSRDPLATNYIYCIMAAEKLETFASVTGTGTAETAKQVQGEACQNGPQGDAQNTPQVSDNEL